MFEHLRASGLIPSNMVARAAAGAQSRSEKSCVMGVVTDEVEMSAPPARGKTLRLRERWDPSFGSVLEYSSNK